MKAPFAKRTKAAAKPAAPVPTPKTLRVAFPPVRIPQADGSVLVKPGQAQVLPEEVTTVVFAREVGISQEYAAQLCEEGLLKHRRKSSKKRSMFLIPASEIERYRQLQDEDMEQPKAQTQSLISNQSHRRKNKP